jgi:hypothetical protein
MSHRNEKQFPLKIFFNQDSEPTNEMMHANSESGKLSFNAKIKKNCTFEELAQLYLCKYRVMIEPAENVTSVETIISFEIRDTLKRSSSELVAASVVDGDEITMNEITIFTHAPTCVVS